jgi:hypothetical protein
MREQIEGGPGLSTTNAAQDLAPLRKGLPDMVASETVEASTKRPLATRLALDLTQRSRADLAWLMDSEDLNKTAIVHRAIQLYRLAREAQIGGGSVTINGETLVFV